MGATESDPHLNTASMLATIATLGKELEILSMSAQNLSRMGYNQDGNQIQTKAKEELKIIENAVKGAEEAKKNFDALAPRFPQLTTEKKELDQSLEELLKAGKELVQSQEDSPKKQASIFPSAGQEQLRELQNHAKGFVQRNTTATGPLRTAKGALASGVNKLGESVSSPSPTAGTSGPLGADKKDESMWQLIEDILLGKVLPQIDKGSAAWNIVVELENAIEKYCGPLVNILAELANDKVRKGDNSADLEKIQQDLKAMRPLLDGVIQKMQLAFYKAEYDEEKLQGGKPPSQWKPTSIGAIFSGLHSSINNLNNAYLKLGNVVNDINGILMIMKEDGQNQLVTWIYAGLKNQVGDANDALSGMERVGKSLGVNVQNQSVMTMASLRQQQNVMQMYLQFLSQFMQSFNQLGQAVVKNTNTG